MLAPNDTPSRPLSDAIEMSIAIAQFLGTKLFNLEAPANLRTRMAGALFSIALDHHVSIVELTRTGHHPSALALLRPIIDAYLRGAWAAYCATDAQLEGYTAGDDAPNPDRIIAALEAHEAFSDGTLAAIKRRIWPTVCDFTHGGIRQVLRFLNLDRIEPNIEDTDLIELLEAADAWAMFSAIAITDLSDREDLALEFLRYADARTSAVQ